MDVVFGLDPSLPKGRAVEHAIRESIARGSLPQGARLPSTRELAAELGVARNTVVAALDSLIAEGVLETRPRAGTFVARAAAQHREISRAVCEADPEFDLRPGRPEHGSFPTARWLAALRRAASPAAAIRADAAGSLELRRQLAAYLARARGVETGADRIVISAGFRTACLLLGAVFAERGLSNIAVEDPSLLGIDRPWTIAGLTVSDIPVDADGADVSRLDAGTDAALLTPSHQFPLGGALHPGRRQQACAWASGGERYIVEDDYDGEFRFDRRPIAALQRSAPEHVIYAGTVSKALDPTLRLGWLALPAELVHPVTEASSTLTGGVPLLNQLALAEFIRTGDYERHIRRQRREYARRRDLLQRALREAGYEAPGIPAGLHTVIPLPDEPRPEHAEGLVVAGPLAMHTLARYSRREHASSALVVGFATPTRAQFKPAIESLIAYLTRTRPGGKDLPDRNGARRFS
ncbi:PLP-dependent aminotransferase family protein [Rhodococcus olei]|uniref:PLP-dependent aminotransferase family protein n=1 Tax=Rhodococcus olei TaxID=2161675 RepID=A0ABP8PNJ7_9NOCA